MALVYDNADVTAMNALTALLNSGYLALYTGSQPALDGSLTGVLLVTLTFGNPAFAGAVSSAGIVSATANQITSGTAGATGTAGYFVLLESDNATVVLTGTVATAGAEVNLTNTAIVSGVAVSLSAFTISQPQS